MITIIEVDNPLRIDKMTGILDPKQRIFDSIITQEGRAQIASGKLKAEYYSFSDSGAIYQLDTIVSGGLDVTYRLCFEATNLPQDMITLEADDSGKLIGKFPGQANEQIIISNGQILSGATREEQAPVSGSQFNSLAGILLSSSIDNFKKLQILASPDPIDKNYNEFIINPKEINFKITDGNLPIETNGIETITINEVESLFQDKRLSHVPNFDFLPPVNRARIGSTEKNSLGDYVNINQSPILTYEDLESEIKQSRNKGYSNSIYFTETSRENNLVCQFFEISKGQMIKLDVIDFGLFPGENEQTSKHVFFAGKIFIDDNGSSTFVNMFTLIFS